MDTRDSIRGRRQERIRRIMELNAKQALEQVNKPQLQSQAVQSEAQGRHPLPHTQVSQALPQQASMNRSASSMPELLPSLSAQQLGEEDPERLWKSNPNPWETAGWRIAPLPSKERRDGKLNGPKQPERDYPFIARGLFIQTVISAAIFCIVFGMFKLDVPAAKQGREVVTIALTEQMDFDAAAALYKKWFAGAPSFIPLFGNHGDEESQLAAGAVELPIVSPLPDGAVVQSFAATLSGVEMAGEPGQAVLAAETGRVIVVSKDDDNMETVVVQHANDRVTIYGHLAKVIVAANDWVEAGKSLGTLAAADVDKQSLLFFAVKEKGRYVNPADVVPLD
ncbi:M23 family metallopeptidase [Paenibacillus sp. R14(2021)]|uniref:M23 family metallopeptidase n=1 Tax=Paenibacillus sp. R14(2021) TaxID=2859228 RepID=UPI001C611E34|nr:M23 family metallopeptidase [Paenibacillus sp. R14(2021)]